MAPGLGMSKSTLYRATHAGKYERIARGIYRPSDAPVADWRSGEKRQVLMEIPEGYPKGTLQLDSATLELLFREPDCAPVSHVVRRRGAAWVISKLTGDQYDVLHQYYVRTLRETAERHAEA